MKSHTLTGAKEDPLLPYIIRGLPRKQNGSAAASTKRDSHRYLLSDIQPTRPRIPHQLRKRKNSLKQTVTNKLSPGEC
ncbi:hypothetical protein NPIL_23921 [Nephila pilipes]|uniref:Uncharacterized protein n=1 Tax=Nephila pilipes TaxID=299642 RepID=A0A8X6QCJ9_NEPPI|nr:hypothetical protein NPIL_23921 [Nephila pilipes]